MTTYEEPDFDPAFARALKLAGPAAGEIAFERRGTGDSTYPMHAIIIEVDQTNGIIVLRRTRTHAGRVQEMALRYFLTATTTQGVKMINRVAVERERKFRDKQLARESAVASALANPVRRLKSKPTKSAFIGVSNATLWGHKLRTYCYWDRDDTQQSVDLAAKSLSAAEQFIAMQDLYMTLDDMLWDAISGHVLWPAGIEWDRQTGRASWTEDWVAIFRELDGIAPDVFACYLKAVRSSSDRPKMPGLTEQGASFLAARGLVGVEPKFQQVLERIPTLAGLRSLLKVADIKPAGTSRSVCIAQLLAHETPALVRAAEELMGPPKLKIHGPCGMTAGEFSTALDLLRDSIFGMRQWLRGDLFRFSDQEAEFLRAKSWQD